jgi:outer membrane biosynthesis protein TonB
MIRALSIAVLLTATPLAAVEMKPGPKEPAPGESWVKVAYDVGKDGDAMSCQVLDTNIDAAMGNRVCQTIVQNWKFDKSARGEKVTQYVVIRK